MAGRRAIQRPHQRRRLRRADIRIAFHTGLDEHRVRERFADYDLYLTKANDAEVLVDEIAALLARAKSVRPDTAAPAEPGFSGKDVLRAQGALRKAMGLGSAALSLRDVLDLVAAEIAQLRKTGRSDADIAALIAAATGRDIPAAAVAAIANGDGPRRATPRQR
jgi:hypothetical protein